MINDEELDRLFLENDRSKYFSGTMLEKQKEKKDLIKEIFNSLGVAQIWCVFGTAMSGALFTTYWTRREFENLTFQELFIIFLIMRMEKDFYEIKLKVDKELNKALNNEKSYQGFSSDMYQTYR